MRYNIYAGYTTNRIPYLWFINPRSEFSPLSHARRKSLRSDFKILWSGVEWSDHSDHSGVKNHSGVKKISNSGRHNK